jgi:hypothetical protein
MTRKLRGLGIVAAVLAVGAVVATAASAKQATLTSDGPVKLSGTDNSFRLTAFGNQKIECQDKLTLGVVNKTPHSFSPGTILSFTLANDLSGCTVSVGATKAPATVTTNKCDVVGHLGVGLIPPGFGYSFDYVCENPEETIEIHAYSSGSHASSICTYKIPPQNGLTGGSAQNIANGQITLGGAITGITVSKTGILCGGTAEEHGVVQDIDAVVSGTNEEGKSTAIEITE